MNIFRLFFCPGFFFSKFLAMFLSLFKPKLLVYKTDFFSFLAEEGEMDELDLEMEIIFS